MLASAAIARSVTYAAANRYVAQEFIDVETAKAAGRSGFGEMIAFLKKQTNCRVVLVEKTDRLYRNLRDVVTIDELGLDLHTVKENVIPVCQPSCRPLTTVKSHLFCSLLQACASAHICLSIMDRVERRV